MPDWLTSDPVFDGPLPLKILASRLLVSLVYGIGVALIYRWSHGRERESSPTLATTLILLSVLIAMVSMTIGNSVARAFSLVGALSIVRFRTVVDDTRDTAFVIFAVIVGMAAGAGLPLIPLVGLPVVAFAAIGLSHFGRRESRIPDAPWPLQVRMGLGYDAQALLSPIFQSFGADARLIGASTARQGAALDLQYQVQVPPESGITPAEIVTRLNQVEGVLGVDLNTA